jgi:hypothetical protein
MSRLDAYDAHGPKPETYDYRIRDGVPVPSKQMALVVDVCYLFQMQLDSTFKPLHARPEDVSAALRIYETRDWMRTPGLRPFTHTQFVRSLSDTERDALTLEITNVLRSGRIDPSDCRD